MMGRVKYRGAESNNNNGSSIQNNNNISNNKITSNGKHRNGAVKRRSKTSSSVTGMIHSHSHKFGFIFVAILIASFSFGIVSGNLNFLIAFFYGLYSQSFISKITGSGIESNNVRLGSGGWRLASDAILRKYDAGVCTIEKISAEELTPERFESEVRFKKPVLVTFHDGASGWTDPDKWSRDSLVKEYSKWSIRSGESLDIVRKGGNGNHKSSFLGFVNELLDNVNNGTETDGEPMNYAFDRAFYWQTKLPKTLRLPQYFKVNRSMDDSIFFLGSSMTGVVFHKHSDTWNGVVYGRKRWFLYPTHHTPPGGVHHGYTILEWVHNVYPNLTDAERPMECVQEAGEILYLPEGTYHATLNMGDTVAVALQKKEPKLQTEILSYEATNLINLLQEDPPKQPKESRRSVRLLEVYKELHKLLPDNAEYMMKMGETLLEMGEYSKSLPWLQKAIEREPYFILAYLQLGRTFAKLKRYDEAEQQFLSAMERSPNFWDVYKDYGEFLYREGRVSDALHIYKRGTELKPEMMPFWYFYKMCQEYLGDDEGAKATEKIMEKLRESSDS